LHITPSVPSADIDAVMDAIAGSRGLELEGEVQDLAGVLNPDAAYAVRGLENRQGSLSAGEWGYYAKQVKRKPGEMLKAWVRWNIQEASYDCYLEADAGEVFDHATPYVGPLY